MIGPTRISDVVVSETCALMVRVAHRTTYFEYAGDIRNVPQLAHWASDLNRDLRYITSSPPTTRELKAIQDYPNLMWQWTSPHQVLAIPPPTTCRVMWTPHMTRDMVADVSLWAANLLLMGVPTQPEIIDAPAWQGVTHFPFRVTPQAAAYLHRGTPHFCQKPTALTITPKGIVSCPRLEPKSKMPCTVGCLSPAVVGEPDALVMNYTRVELLAVWWASGVDLDLTGYLWDSVSHIDYRPSYERRMTLITFQTFLTALVFCGALQCPMRVPCKVGLPYPQLANYRVQMGEWADDGSWYLLIHLLKKHHQLGALIEKAKLPLSLVERLHNRYGNIHTQRIGCPSGYVQRAVHTELSSPGVPPAETTWGLSWRAIADLRLRVHATELVRVETVRRPDPLAFLLRDV